MEKNSKYFMKKSDEKIFNRVVQKSYVPTFLELDSEQLCDRLIEHYSINEKYFYNIPTEIGYTKYNIRKFLELEFIKKGIPIKYRVRKDNLNPKTNGINYSGGSNVNKIRIPSRKHKNKFKNFIKIFPNFCERNNIKL